jgi:polyisoprenoid-binding protein YceI
MGKWLLRGCFSAWDVTMCCLATWGNTRIAVSATTKINRKDFGLTWNAALETGGILVGDEVTITLDVEFIKA